MKGQYLYHHMLYLESLSSVSNELIFFLVVPTVQVLLCFYTTAYFGHPNGACFRVKTHSFRLKKQFSSEDTQVSSEDTQCSSEDTQFSSEDTQFSFEAMLFPQLNLYLIDPSDIL